MIPIYPTKLDNSAYILDTDEAVRNLLWNYIYDLGLPDKLMKAAYLRDQIGKDSLCFWSEMLFYHDLIDYIVLMFEEVRSSGVECGTQEFIDMVKTFNLDCIKKTLVCRYGSSGVVDGAKNALIDTMINKIDLCCPEGSGISEMQIAGTLCNVFHVYPQV